MVGRLRAWRPRRREMGPVSAVGVVALVLLALLATPMQRPPELQSISRRPRHGRSLQPARHRAVPGARRHLARLPPLRRDGRADGARGDRGARLFRLQRRHHPRAVAGAGRARRRDLCASTCAATASPARAAISAMSASSRTISPISSRCLRKTVPSAPLTLVGHSSGGGFALRVAARRSRTCSSAPCCLRPISATTRRPRAAESAGGWAKADVPRIVGADGAARGRHRLLRCAAGAGVRGAAEFGEGADRRPIPTG